MTQEAERSPSESRDDRPEFDGLTVMLVEDNARLRGLVCQTLESLGCTVVTAADAGETQRVLDTRADVRLLLSDIRMPGRMDGIALAEWVSERHPDIAILLITGFTHVASIRFPVLSKPFGPEQLVAAMHEVLGPQARTGA